MICLAVLQVLLLFSVAGKVTSSKNAIRIQEAFNEMIEKLQTSLSLKEHEFDTSDSKIFSDEDTDRTLTDFLGNSMGTYTNWLAMDDPLRPDPTEIILSTVGLSSKLGNELEAILKISNQRMVDHSISGPSLVFPFSEKSKNTLAVARAVLDGPDVIFTGDYTASGFFKVSPSLSIPFNGKGWWAFYGSDLAEMVTYEGYTVNQNGNINISASLSTKYSCLITWSDVEFKGLHFDYKKEIDVTWMFNLKRQLAELYALFLEEPLTFEKFKNQIPPKRLLTEYLDDSLTSLKLAHSIPRVQRRTMSKVTDNASIMHRSNLGLFLLMMSVYFNI